MNATARPNLLDAGLRFTWAAVLLTLPVTSFRYFPGDDGTYVRPLALYPLTVLALILFIQLARRKISFPAAGALTPLLAFLLAAAAAGVLGLLLSPVPVRGQDALGRIARAWATILIGVAFFGASVWINRTEVDLRFTLKWLLAGLVLDMLWSSVQGATFYLHVLPKPLVTHWQRAFSMRELIRTNRVSGLAYEPSWLAGQLATVYLPWLFASVLTGQRLTRHKWLEPGLFVLALVLLLATYSRGGLLTVAVAAALTLLFVGRDQIRAAAIWLFTGYRGGRRLGLKIGSLILMALAAAGALLFLEQKGYIARLWSTQASSVEDFLIANSAGARAAYTWSALAAYGEHPWLGVGPGASGLYMYNHLPDWALTTVPEIARQLSPDSALYPNPKNLYVRLLAETGLIGFFLFLAFQFFVLGDALAALRQGSRLWRFLAVAGIFTWFALVVYNMTQDSLAIPNLWINLGVLAGMSTVIAGSGKVGPEPGQR